MRDVLAAIDDWPVPHVAAAVVDADGTLLAQRGDLTRWFSLASLTKMMTAWAVLIAVEEGIVALDQPVGPPGATLHHLLAHASGVNFEDETVLAPPGTRRIYSNTGIELAAAAVSSAADMPFDRYVREAVFEPLGMRATRLRGSPAYAVLGTTADVARFLAESHRPQLLAADHARMATTPQFPDIAGIVPGLGRFDPCPWGLGFELRGDKAPHWTGMTNSPATYGHFGASGTMAWFDPEHGCGLVALTDKRFDEWGATALRSWSALSDAVVAAVADGSITAG